MTVNLFNSCRLSCNNKCNNQNLREDIVKIKSRLIMGQQIKKYE